MANPIPRYSLEVVGGEDHGAKIVVDLNVRTIGRARDADLVLRDLAVSRRHVQVVANEGGVSFATLPSASPFVADGRPVRSLDAKPGDRILLGNTMIVVGGGPEAGAATPPAHTDVRTLLTGAAADVRGLAAAHALVDALDAAADAPAIALAVRSWAADHLGASEAEVERIEARRAGGAAVEETREASGAILVTVPAPCAEPVRLAVRFPATAGGVTDPHRRTLVVAGRILGAALARARQVEVAEGEVAALRTLGVGSARTYLGHSEEAKRIATLIPRVGALDFGVLIEGETGVGKTFVARLIHESSPRAREPLRIINCAAIPEALLESELFGHERGAFTGAMTARAGAFEAVGGGTLLLDEVGELSLAGQAKLLRVLE